MWVNGPISLKGLAPRTSALQQPNRPEDQHIPPFLGITCSELHSAALFPLLVAVGPRVAPEVDRPQPDHEGFDSRRAKVSQVSFRETT